MEADDDGDGVPNSLDLEPDTPRGEIVNFQGIGITQKGIEWQIIRLKKDGILERIGPARGGYWKVIEKKL